MITIVFIDENLNSLEKNIMMNIWDDGKFIEDTFKIYIGSLNRKLEDFISFDIAKNEVSKI